MLVFMNGFMVRSGCKQDALALALHTKLNQHAAAAAAPGLQKRFTVYKATQLERVI